MDGEMSAEQALELALNNVRTAAASEGDSATWATELADGLRALGFKVAKDAHSNRWGPPTIKDGHDCYHCDRPENSEPFVVPGTPLELLSSESDAGRFRHWGGSDMWVCRTHPSFMNGDVVESRTQIGRTMEIYEALEHLAARDELPDAVRLTHADLAAMEETYLREHRDQLAALDSAAPHGGHQARQASTASS